VNNKTLEHICAELAQVLTGQKFGKIFTLTRLSLAIDFRLHESLFLLISVEPSAPRIYLIKRRLRDLEKQSGNPGPFTPFLRKRLSNAVLQSVEKVSGERILIFKFSVQTELGEIENYSFVVQLTGRSANLFLCDKNGFILDKIRETFGAGQEIGGKYSAPVRGNERVQTEPDAVFPHDDRQTLSEALDIFYLEKEAEKLFQNRAKAAESKLKQELAKREKLVKKLNLDLFNHGDAEKWKRFGDLILANLADAVRIDTKVLVVDYFDENIPTLEIEIDENDSLTQAAEKFFRRYTKARNALETVSKRLRVLETEISNLKEKQAILNEAIAAHDDDFLTELLGVKIEKLPVKLRDRKTESFTGARRFVSSDAFEILVGKASKDNDFLTFRVAKSFDLWLHAADYPGSHVIVKNPNRKEIPPNTLVEAAQLAAFYSHAREQPKVAVHYTQKKFVNKPKGAAFGLVSLSSFKTILVEPKITVGA
jgi:predicted ribosome quality control (RQC) complex YloA/Tae2 family protein